MRIIPQPPPPPTRQPITIEFTPEEAAHIYRYLSARWWPLDSPLDVLGKIILRAAQQ